MPPLYALALAGFFPSSRSCALEPRDAHGADYLASLLTRYPTSLYPILALLLQTRVYALEDEGGAENSLNAGLSHLGWSPEERNRREVDSDQVASLDIASGSIDVYRLNNIIHQSQGRQEVLREAARVVRPGGLLLLTDNTAGWVESIWTVRLARAMGRHLLAARLIQDKLKSSHQRLVPDADWWTTHLPEPWALVAVRPFFSRDAMTCASLFESLNFKLGGAGPEWLTGRVVRNPILRSVYRWLLEALGRTLVRADARLVERSGATSLMVILRRRPS